MFRTPDLRRSRKTTHIGPKTSSEVYKKMLFDRYINGEKFDDPVVVSESDSPDPYRGLEAGVCSTCRSTAYRDSEGVCFHPAGVITPDNPCRDSRSEEEEGLTVFGVWFRPFPIGDRKKLIPSYCFFELALVG